MRRLLASTLLLPLLALAGPAAATVRVPEGRVELDAAARSLGSSYLTTVSRGRTRKLVLIGSDGEPHVLLRHRSRGRFDAMSLVDWSPDGRTALLRYDSRAGTRAASYDLVTGETRTVRLTGEVDSVRLDPDGSGVLSTVFDEDGGTPFVLQRVAWDGTVTTLPEHTAGSLLPGPDHTVMTRGAGNRQRVLRILDLDTGTTLRTYRTGAFCVPVRWWDDARVLVRCGADLSLVDWATGARVSLTTKHRGADLGHLDARRIDSGIYVQVAGGCGSQWLGERVRGRGVRRVDVPGAVGNVDLIGGAGRWLVVRHADDCDGGHPRSVLALFDPTTSQERPLVQLGPRQQFGAIHVSGEVSATP